MTKKEKLNLFWPAAVAACMEFHCNIALGYVGTEIPVDMPAEVRACLETGLACYVAGIGDTKLWREEFSLYCQSEMIICAYYYDGALLLLDVERLGLEPLLPPADHVKQVKMELVKS